MQASSPTHVCSNFLSVKPIPNQYDKHFYCNNERSRIYLFFQVTNESGNDNPKKNIASISNTYTQVDVAIIQQVSFISHVNQTVPLLTC